MTTKSVLFLYLIVFFAVQAFAQWSREERERIDKLSQEDHRLMMKQLGITELRPGPSGNSEAPNAANTDELKATPYTSLPDPLLFNGAKILRRNLGEQVENLASSGGYHWFAPNFIKYAGPFTALDLPVDAHELVALCAPRPVFISVGSPEVEGQWIDAKGMFLACVHAGPVYELLGKTGMGTTQFPPQETSLIDGETAFRQHAGGHTVGPNWPVFIKYAEKYFSK